MSWGGIIKDRRFACAEVINQCAIRLGLMSRRETSRVTIVATMNLLEDKGLLFIFPGSERRVRSKRDGA